VTGQEGGHIGSRIRTAREDLGLSQTQLAAALNVRERTVDRWETGKNQPEISQLRGLSRTLQVSLTYLLGVDEPNGDPAVAA